MTNNESHKQESQFIQFSPLLEDKFISDFFPFIHFYDFSFL